MIKTLKLTTIWKKSGMFTKQVFIKQEISYYISVTFFVLCV